MAIVAAVDRTDEAGTVVEQGAKLAAAFDDELHVVHVLNMSDFVDLERTSVDESGEGVNPDRIREVARSIAEGQASDRTERFTPVGLIGNSAAEILEYAEEEDAEYIVVGGRRRSPVGKVIFGSVTQSVLLNADRPVVTVMHD